MVWTRGLRRSAGVGGLRGGLQLRIARRKLSARADTHQRHQACGGRKATHTKGKPGSLHHKPVADLFSFLYLILGMPQPSLSKEDLVTTLRPLSSGAFERGSPF